MSRIRFYNAKILTMEEPVKVIEDGELRTDGKVIEYAGPKEDTPKDRPSFDREIDCKWNLLMPGFKDAHTHSAMTLMRSYADDMPLQDWLNQMIFPVEGCIDIYNHPEACRPH